MTGPRIRFGAFELDRAAGELRKHGVKVPLSGQPLEVLALLADRASEVVTREDLKEALWPEETFVDFDNGVNSAIRRIRRALDDSATTPKFIETLPKRGYRFIGGVDERGPQRPAFVADRRLAWILGGIALVALLGWWVTRNDDRPEPASDQALSIVPLTTLPGIEKQPTLSPDGSQVAFSWNGEDRRQFSIYVKSASGNEAPRRLTEGPFDDVMPAWSPDGQKIAFWRSNGARSGVYLVSPTGGAAQAVLADRPPLVRWSSQLSWSPDGEWVAFSDTLDSAMSISAVSHLTGAVRVLVERTKSVLLRYPAFSPDGKALAFFGGEIKTLSLASGRMRSWGGSTGLDQGGVAWSRDSGSVYFGGGPPGSLSLMRLNLETGLTERIPGPGSAAEPTTARHVDTLAYSALASRNFDVLRVERPRASGESSRAATVLASTRMETAAQISPKSDRIVFGSVRTGQPRLWIVDSGGSHANAVVIPGTGSAPRWSPDGRQIAYDLRGVHLVDVDRQAPRLLTDPAHRSSQPCWSDDGSTVYFSSWRSGEREIWRKPASGAAAAQQVTHSGGGRCWVSGGYVYFGRGADILRVPEQASSSEELVLEGTQFLNSGFWQVRDDWLYFIDFDQGWRSGRWALKKMKLSTREIVEMQELPQQPAHRNGLSVAADESWFVYTVDNSAEQDLMMIEGLE